MQSNVVISQNLHELQKEKFNNQKQTGSTTIFGFNVLIMGVDFVGQPGHMPTYN